MGCSMDPPAFTCRPSCCQDGRELRLISRGALCHQATEAHVRIAQDAQSLGCVPLLDGLVDGSNAQGHCGEMQRGLRLGQEAVGPRGGEHLPSPSSSQRLLKSRRPISPFPSGRDPKEQPPALLCCAALLSWLALQTPSWISSHHKSTPGSPVTCPEETKGPHSDQTAQKLAMQPFFPRQTSRLRRSYDCQLHKSQISCTPIKRIKGLCTGWPYISHNNPVR